MLKKVSNFKKTIVLLFCCMILFSFHVYADDTITIKMDGREIYCDQPPIIVNGTTIIPLRAVSEEMGYQVKWNEQYQQVTIIDNGKGCGAGMDMYIGDTKLITGGGIKTLPVAPVIINDRTYVPIRVIAEVLNCKVEWDDTSKTVEIYSSYRPSDYY